MRFLFTGGGTAGHINPALAVADYARARQKDAEFLFVGTRSGMEAEFVPKAGYNIEFIDIQGFKRSLSPENFKTVMKIFTGVGQAKAVIRQFQPDVIVGTGGYVSGPVIYAGARMKIPTLSHCCDALPGIAARVSAKYAGVSTVAFDEAAQRLNRAGRRIVVTGNPIRPAILAVSREEARRRLGLDDRPFILAVGGSLGAAALNAAVAELIAVTAPEGKLQYLAGTGKGGSAAMAETLRRGGVELDKYPSVRVADYIFDMELALGAADLVISRSGGAICEFAAVGVPSILIPSPNVTANHQEFNARSLEKKGGAAVILERELSGRRLTKTVLDILSDKARLERMRNAAKKAGKPNATRDIYELAAEIAAKKT